MWSKNSLEINFILNDETWDRIDPIQGPSVKRANQILENVNDKWKNAEKANYWIETRVDYIKK